MDLFGLGNVSKQAVDEAANKLSPIIQKVQDGLTEAINFAVQNGIDRIKSGKVTITITFDFPPPKAVPVENG